MESSQIFGGTEECHSSESGWTMYIGSPTQGDDGDDEGAHSDYENFDGNDGSDGDDTDGHHEEDYSDDSMASDASSGPSTHQWHPFSNRESSYSMAHRLKLHHEEDRKCNFDKRAKRQMEKLPGAERTGKEEKEEMVLMPERKTGASAQSASKVRKSIWTSKRK